MASLGYSCSRDIAKEYDEYCKANNPYDPEYEGPIPDGPLCEGWEPGSCEKCPMTMCNCNPNYQK